MDSQGGSDTGDWDLAGRRFRTGCRLHHVLSLETPLFCQDQLAVILNSRRGSGCSLQSLLPPGGRRPPQQVRRPLCRPPPVHFIRSFTSEPPSNVGAALRALSFRTALLQVCPTPAFSPPSGLLNRYSTRLSSKVTLLPSTPSFTLQPSYCRPENSALTNFLFSSDFYSSPRQI